MPSTTKGLPRRTGVSGLSDDELLLLDALFSRPARLMTLQQAWYSSENSVSYTHSLDDAALEAKLDEWVRLGLLQQDQQARCGGDQWRMTAVAGQLWESERKPPWEAFCSTTVRFYRRKGTPGETDIFRIKAFSDAPIRAVVDDLQRNPDDWWPLADPPDRLLIEPCGELLLYWKSLPLLEGRIRVYLDRNAPSWVKPTRPQPFWRNLGELSRYRGDAHS